MKPILTFAVFNIVDFQVRHARVLFVPDKFPRNWLRGLDESIGHGHDPHHESVRQFDVAGIDQAVGSGAGGAHG